MDIGNYKSNPTYHVSFKSGLTKDILNESFRIKSKEVESFLCTKKNIDCNFLNNTPNTIGTLLTEHIFSKLASISQGFGAKPPRIRTFIAEDLVKPQNQNFCIKDSQIVLKNEPPFEMRSIFYKQEKSLKDIDEQIEEEFHQGKRSSNHFLADYIHEWIHNIHLNAIYSKHGYGGKCPYGQSQYPNTNYNKTGIEVVKELENKTLTKTENELTKDILGEYSTDSKNQYFEILSETFTQLICKSLSKDCLSFKKNPFELLNKYPAEFKQIIIKILNSS